MDDGLNPITAPQTKGAMIFFPSWIHHQVCKVLSGTRKSIVIWALGPMYK